MLFSSTVFLFLFLPIVLLLYYISPKQLRNLILLFASLFFYAWGEVTFSILLIASIILNYSVGRLIGKYQDGQKSKLFLIIGIVANLGLLATFKYSGFFIDNINIILGFFQIDLIRSSQISDRKYNWRWEFEEFTSEEYNLTVPDSVSFKMTTNDR